MNSSPADSPLKLAVLISGSGTTLRNLLDFIADGRLTARIELVVSSKPTARGLNYAREANIPSLVVDRRQVVSDDAYSDEIFSACRRHAVDIVVMGGFLTFVPIPDDFQNRVTNIHPALIPAFCGKGYYGRRVHEAVLDYGAKVSGCTVHFVDNQYDHGPIILQRTVRVHDGDTPEMLAARVFVAECKAYPEALQAIAEGRVTVHGRRVRVRPDEE